MRCSNSNYPAYPLESLPSNTTWCDIGGGIGASLMELAELHPHLLLTLQDLPNVVEHAQTVCISCSSQSFLPALEPHFALLALEGDMPQGY
jgi:hypothetical protein